MVAALFVATGGVYFNCRDVQPWDEVRDARRYDGPYPVVAHPPCQLWVNFAALNYKRYGGEHNRPGNDSGCFSSALASVRLWGGVLEHPAGSHAWRTFDLEVPTAVGWQRTLGNEWVCEVWQSAYGLAARKRTWLLYVGDLEPKPLDWRRIPGTHQIGVGFRANKKPRLRGRAASAVAARVSRRVTRPGTQLTATERRMTTISHLIILAIGLVAGIPIGCLLTVEYLARRTAFPLAIPVATARTQRKLRRNRADLRRALGR